MFVKNVIANPIALLLSALQLLQHIGLHKTKLRIENPLIQTLKDGIKTLDLDGKANTKQFVSVIIERIEASNEDQFVNTNLLRIKSEL